MCLKIVEIFSTKELISSRFPGYLSGRNIYCCRNKYTHIFISKINNIDVGGDLNLNIYFVWPNTVTVLQNKLFVLNGTSEARQLACRPIDAFTSF